MAVNIDAACCCTLTLVTQGRMWSKVLLQRVAGTKARLRMPALCSFHLPVLFMFLSLTLPTLSDEQHQIFCILFHVA